MARLTSLLVVLWVGVTVGSLVDLQKRIIGGHDCLDTERGYHVFLTFNDEPYCSGSLISEDWILTAAHCWEPGGIITAVFGRDPNSTNRVTITDEPKIYKKKKAGMINIFKHKESHDIMLLKLPDPTDITPVPLPVDCANKPNIGDDVEIAGYYSTAGPGDNKTESHRIDTTKPLQCATTNVIECYDVNRCVKDSKYKHPHLLCYQDRGVDTTKGDSGGGVEYNGILYGFIVSSIETACIRPAAAMDVCSYMPWIGSIVFDPKQKCGGCAGALKKFCQKYFTCG